MRSRFKGLRSFPGHLYIELLPPGRYTVRAKYAFGSDLGTVQEKDRSFMLLSDPVTVEILPPKTLSEP